MSRRLQGSPDVEHVPLADGHVTMSQIQWNLFRVVSKDFMQRSAGYLVATETDKAILQTFTVVSEILNIGMQVLKKYPSPLLS
jgi:predicted phage gp36 major capsid-like protein